MILASRHSSAATGVHPRTWPSVLVLGATVAACNPGERGPGWPTDGWPKSTPAEQGLDPRPFDALHQAIDSGQYGNIDRILVIRNGKLVVDHRYPRDYRAISRGQRSAFGCGEGACEGFKSQPDFNYFDPTQHPYREGREVHTLQSVTKSVSATVLATAIKNGRMTGTDAPLLSFFDGFDLSKVDPRLKRATLTDLLTMRSGIEWHEEDRPLDSTNTTLQLENAHNWVQFTLDQPMDADPGSKWAYNSGGSHLMSQIVRKATDSTIDIYAEKHLFGPLGITDYYWKKTPTGLPDTEGGLYLRSEDLAKIGYLYLRDGVWNGTRLLPDGWVAKATARQVDSVNTDRWGYGYQWWRLDRRGTEVWAGLGFGGQFLLVLPKAGTIGVVNSWNLFGRPSRDILADFLDALIASVGKA